MDKKHFSIAGTVTVGPKGQVVIPSETRGRLGIQPGDKLIALEVEGKQSIAFITEKQAQEMVEYLGEKAGLMQNLQSKLEDARSSEHAA